MSFTLAVLVVRVVEVPLEPCNAKLGGTYGVLFVPGPLALSPSSKLRTNLDKTPSTMVFLTPFFVISFLRSARAASVTPGPVKSSMTDGRAHSRTCASPSSRAATS